MNFLRLLPVFLSSVAPAAQLLRSGMLRLASKRSTSERDHEDETCSSAIVSQP